MRVGMAGLSALYWPVAMGRGLQGREKVAFVAAATLGVKPAAIQQTLGMSAEEYAARFGVRLYEQAEEMVARERLDTVVLITRHTEHGAGVMHYMRHFEGCLLDKAAPSPGVRDGAKSIAVCSAAWQSIRKGGVVKVRSEF